MDKIIQVDNVHFSKKIWDWFNDNKHLASEDTDDEIRLFFRFLQPGSEKKRYTELTAGEFFMLLMELSLMTLGYHTHAIERHYEIADIRLEFSKVKSTIIKWCMFEDFTYEDIGNLEKDMIDVIAPACTESGTRESLRLKKSFHYKCYYFYKDFEEQIDKLENLIGGMKRIPGEMEENSDSKNSYIVDNNKKAMVRFVRKAYAGDLDSFINEVMESYYDGMSKNHEKIAQMIRCEKLDIPNFEEMMSPNDIWRFLFYRYFDGFENEFDMFYNEFRDGCVLFYMNDYLHTTFNIVKIPIYNIFTNDDGETFSNDVEPLINEDDINKRIKYIYKTRLNGINYMAGSEERDRYNDQDS
jgi:hypothetical protein